MRRLLLSATVLFLIAIPEVGFSVDMEIQTGLNFEWWKDDAGTRATQSYLPVRIEGRQNDFSFRVLTAYVDTRMDLPGPETRSLSHLLDTKLNFSYELVGKLPVDLMLGLDFNLPTGKTELNDRDLALMTDPDLFSINQFGEGFNVNPTLSLSKEWGDWVAGIGLGYAFRGSYDLSTTLRDFHPGDIANCSAQIRYDFSRNWQARVFGSFAWFGEEGWNRSFVGKERYQEGAFFMVGSGISYTEQKWEAGFILRSVFRQKSKFEDEGRFSTENGNHHGDEWIGDLSFRYFLTQKTALRSLLQGRLVTANDYPSSPLFLEGRPNRFIGQREKLSLGVGIHHAFSPHVEVGVFTKGFLMHDEQALFPEIRDQRSYKGVSVGLQVTALF